MEKSVECTFNENDSVQAVLIDVLTAEQLDKAEVKKSNVESAPTTRFTNHKKYNLSDRKNLFSLLNIVVQRKMSLSRILKADSKPFRAEKAVFAPCAAR